MRQALYPSGMRRVVSLILCVLVLAFSLAGCAGKNSTPSASDVKSAQSIVDSATDTLRTHLEGEQKTPVSQLIAKAKGIMIVPGMGSVSFFLSFGGGRALLMAKEGDSWSGPVFFSKGAGGIGVQAGITKTSGLILYMNEEDVRYVLETGALLQGRAAITFLDKDYEGNRTPEFIESGEVIFIGDTSGLYAGIGVNAGGLSNKLTLNAAYHNVVDGDPENILYTVKTVPGGAAHLVDLLEMSGAVSEKETKKDGIEIPSN